MQADPKSASTASTSTGAPLAYCLHVLLERPYVESCAEDVFEMLVVFFDIC